MSPICSIFADRIKNQTLLNNIASFFINNINKEFQNLIKDLENNIGESFSNKKVSIIFGAEENVDIATDVAYRYSNLQNCKTELQNVKNKLHKYIKNIFIINGYVSFSIYYLIIKNISFQDNNSYTIKKVTENSATF